MVQELQFKTQGSHHFSSPALDRHTLTYLDILLSNNGIFVTLERSALIRLLVTVLLLT